MKVNKTIAGVQSEGYPHTYYGRNEFTYDGTTYPVINAIQMSTMPVIDYENRLADFKSYVESIEAGLNVDETTDEGAEAYRVNTTACPII